MLSAASLAPPYFSTLSLKRHDFYKNLMEHKICILILSTTFVSNISHSEVNSARYFHKCGNVFVCSTRYFCRIFVKREFSRQSFEKGLNIKFLHNLSTESRVVSYRQTDRHDEANCRFLQF
jgi:hypothetical protein